MQSNPEKDAGLLAELSPLRQVDKIVDPLFIYAGANDQRVPRSESDLIVKTLRERNVPVGYMVATNEGTRCRAAKTASRSPRA